MGNDEEQHFARLKTEEQEFIQKFRNLTEAEQQTLIDLIMNEPCDILNEYKTQNTPTD